MAGRKSTYDTVIVPRIEEIKEWLQQGKTDKECAKMLGITPRTFSKHKNSISSFSSIIKKERQPKVEEIENSMFESAIGFTKTVKKAMKVKTVEYENGKRLLETEKIEYYDEEIYIPPNTTAGIFLLKNWGDYTNEPQNLILKKRELDFKKKIAENNNFDLD
jgi:DNA-binding CsgD family transcriptional regulator